MEDVLFNLLLEKGSLKQTIYNNTLTALNYFNTAAYNLEKEFYQKLNNKKSEITIKYQPKTEHDFQIQFAGDVLLFMMHTNIFEFPRDHEVMKTSYIKEDKKRSYCGTIFIFNFLSDSIKYNRVNDSGFLIGRIFINKDMHYYVEGKRELAQVLNNFSSNCLTPELANEILRSAIKYTLNFDLLVPDFDLMKEVNVGNFLDLEVESRLTKTSKRLGFRFQADK